MRIIKTLTGLFIAFLIGFTCYAIYQDKWGDGFGVVEAPTPADTLSTTDAEVAAIMQVHATALASEMSSAVLPRIEDSLTMIGEEYGQDSVQYTQGLSEAALMLSSGGRDDLAIPYMERALESARQIYGNTHRETALILNDLAKMQIFNSGVNYAPESIPLLREAAAIRDEVIGADHPETYGARMTLSDMLYYRAQTETGETRIATLEEGLNTISKAHEAVKENVNATELEVIAMGMLRARFAFAKEDYSTAVTIYADSLPAPSTMEDASYIVVFQNAYGEYIDALRKTGDDEGADQLIEAIRTRVESDAQAAGTDIDGAETEATSPEQE